MINFRTFGRPLEWIIHDIPCLLARVTRYDKPWKGKSWRSELSGLNRWVYQNKETFEFALCLHKGASGYTVIDWHSTSPKMSLVYFTVKDDVLEVRFDTELVYSRPIIDSEWLRFKVFILFSPTGRLTIECDGVEVVNQLGRTLYDKDDDSYFQAGVYKFTPWADNEDQIRVCLQL